MWDGVLYIPKAGDFLDGLFIFEEVSVIGGQSIKQSVQASDNKSTLEIRRFLCNWLLLLLNL